MCLFLSHIREYRGSQASAAVVFHGSRDPDSFHAIISLEMDSPFPKPLDVQDACWTHLSLQHSSQQKGGGGEKNMPPSLKILPEVAHDNFKIYAPLARTQSHGHTIFGRIKMWYLL